MLNTELVRTIIGIIGNFVSFGLFASPIPTFMKICKQKSVQCFKPDPYLATILNCAMWVFYGLPFVHSHNILVVTINTIGLVMELIYITIFFAFGNWATKKKIMFVLLVEALFIVIVVFITLKVTQSPSVRAAIVGIICIIFNVIMYAAPLTIMYRVIRTKSVKYMPFALALANLLNGGIWLTYALLKFDIFIAIPNGLGALSGTIQVLLYLIYYKSTNWDEDEEVPVEANNERQPPPPEVQVADNV